MDDLPKLNLTFGNSSDAFTFVTAMQKASENVIWEQRVLENGNILVSVLSTKSLEDKEEEDLLDDTEE